MRQPSGPGACTDAPDAPMHPPALHRWVCECCWLQRAAAARDTEASGLRMMGGMKTITGSRAALAAHPGEAGGMRSGRLTQALAQAGGRRGALQPCSQPGRAVSPPAQLPRVSRWAPSRAYAPSACTLPAGRFAAQPEASPSLARRRCCSSCSSASRSSRARRSRSSRFRLRYWYAARPATDISTAVPTTVTARPRQQQ